MSKRSEIIEVLRDDLYVRVDDETPTSMTWRSPLKWTVKISGPPDDPIVTVLNPMGLIFEGIEERHMDWADLHALLP